MVKRLQNVVSVVGWLNVFALMWAIILGYGPGWFISLVVLVLNILAVFALMGREVKYVAVPMPDGVRMNLFAGDPDLDDDEFHDRLAELIEGSHGTD